VTAIFVAGDENRLCAGLKKFLSPAMATKKQNRAVCGKHRHQAGDKKRLAGDKNRLCALGFSDVLHHNANGPFQYVDQTEPSLHAGTIVGSHYKFTQSKEHTGEPACRLN